MKEALGPTAEQILEENNTKTQDLEQQNRQDEEIRDAPDTSPEDRRAAETRIAAREGEIQELERQSEAVEERMSLRERVKAILKKYGVGVLGVLVAGGTVIGVILGALQRGLAGVAQGVGRGLKAIGKKDRGPPPWCHRRHCLVPLPHSRSSCWFLSQKRLALDRSRGRVSHRALQEEVLPKQPPSRTCGHNSDCS